MKIEYEEIKKWKIENGEQYIEIKPGDKIRFTINDNCNFDESTVIKIQKVLNEKGFLTGCVCSLSSARIEIRLLDEEFYHGTYFKLKPKNLKSISFDT